MIPKHYHDLYQVSNITTEDRGVLYTEKDLDNSLDKIETMNFHEEIEVNGIRFWSYNAGHVLGAAMFMIEIAGVKLLYTGMFVGFRISSLSNIFDCVQSH